MLPAHLARNIRDQVLYYLQSTFAFRDGRVERAFQRFIEDPENGLFKGPWVQLKRPFRPAHEGFVPPFAFDPGFHPFVHQSRSWTRLHSNDQKPSSTIVTTGTGSGKTECFLFPILDHCLRARRQGQNGVKAIILYPMNALASDQEKRFARVIWNTPILKGHNIRVGTYTGRYDPADPGAGFSSGTKAMGEDHGITNHEAQQENPPDILLTNYRMLDFLLMRPQDQNLWLFNEPGVLQYLVLDELHTYDGAQGSDVACLIRRLKERLGAKKGELCVVGTSATLDERAAIMEREESPNIDAKETQKDRLALFAGKLFEEDIASDAVIDEDRLSVPEIVAFEVEEPTIPDPAQCDAEPQETALVYTQRQALLWGGPGYVAPTDPNEEEAALDAWELALGQWLRHCALFKRLLEIFQEAERNRQDPVLWNDLLERLVRMDYGLQQVAMYEDRERVLASFLALVAHAQELRSGRSFPLVPTQVQLWLRELRRLGRLVSDVPLFTWLDEPPPDRRCLPTFQCSECHESGWIALHDPSKDALVQSRGVHGIQLASDAGEIYKAWFGYKGERNRRILVICPDSAEVASSAPATGQEKLDFGYDYLCEGSLVLRQGDGPCPLTGDGRRFRVKVNQDTKKNKSEVVVGDQGCPNCGSKEGVFFVGSQAATLSSVAIDELFGSVLNNDPKLLAFTDSVQDASHRAGFFTARTYRFTLRTAIQHVIDEAGAEGVPLAEIGQRLFQHWGVTGRLGSEKEVMAALIPPDLQQYPDYLHFRNEASIQPPPRSLREAIDTRWVWEATSEFGLMQTHGRTMEPNGAAALGWKAELIEQTVLELRGRLEGISPILVALHDDQLALWVLGVLHRQRLRGAVNHPYLQSYAQQNFWGKYPFNRVYPGRETYPHAGRYRPKFMVTEPQREHDHFLAPSRGSRPPWTHIWTRRAFGLPNLEEAAVLDLLKELLAAGTTSGLLQRIHRDGLKDFYAISSKACVLYSDVVNLVCSESQQSLVRPINEAGYWLNAPSMEYYAGHGRYADGTFNVRQRYYQQRYRKGALRRVVASEHTGLLETELREDLERAFSQALHQDDPNVLACTSTLEMGIDIGDLSSTMLCSIPPTTASYLQRIGRAGRATGTALIVSIVNQKPHDLFFYARPTEMLKGKVDPPGCWLDASAVLARQYFGFCIDKATQDGVLQELPRTARQLADDMQLPEGHFPRLFEWMTKNEDELRGIFLRRFAEEYVRPDTRERFIRETTTELLRNLVHAALNEYDRTRRDLENALRRLKTLLEQLTDDEKETITETEREIKLLRGRLTSYNKSTSLELLTDHGLLPNYAFPERGVRFYGAIYNRHQGAQQETQPVEITRAARPALRELAPSNYFYTHSRQFEIQQISIGNPQQPLIEEWAICGLCGHMRRTEEMDRPDSPPACPQCGHGGDHQSQTDIGQRKRFLEFPRSQAMSFMEHYESLSGDRDEERQQEYYRVLTSFDHTLEAPAGAVGDDELPFGIEYRASMIMREINTGFHSSEATVPFGHGQAAPEEGFFVCADCGVVQAPDEARDKVKHRKSCKFARAAERLKSEGRAGNPYQWKNTYLYRELRSEALRLLLPLTNDEDIDTLKACIYLGLRLRFEGNPAHLIVESQVLPGMQGGIDRHYLVLMDAVPGGTGFLKSLFQQIDELGRAAEGMMEVLRLAKGALETCPCRMLVHREDEEDTDGCYRCIRTFHLQHAAERLSRERGIRLLTSLIESGSKRTDKEKLDSIKLHNLFGSVLEQRFVDALRDFVETSHGIWEKTIVKGNRGFRFSLGGRNPLWELELQPRISTAQGVQVASQPDFQLTCDSVSVRPMLIFTDGFEFHCHPNNRLADDLHKRNAILASQQYLLWNVTWDDLKTDGSQPVRIAPDPLIGYANQFADAARGNGRVVPTDTLSPLQSGLEQLLAFIKNPITAGWANLARFVLVFPLSKLLPQRQVSVSELRDYLADWVGGPSTRTPISSPNGEMVFNDRVAGTTDFLTFSAVSNVLAGNEDGVVFLAKISHADDAVKGSSFKDNWRTFLAAVNFYQFANTPVILPEGSEQDIDALIKMAGLRSELSEEWRRVQDNAISELATLIADLSAAAVPLPTVEYYPEGFPSGAFAELAWSSNECRIAVLCGEQEDYASHWQNSGWKVFTQGQIRVLGSSMLINAIGRSSAEWPH